MNVGIIKSLAVYSWCRGRLLLTTAFCMFGLLVVLKIFGPYSQGTLFHFLLLVLPILNQIMFLFVAVTIFTYANISSDILQTEPDFPRHLFSLPVTTHGLVFWPFLFGAAMIAVPGGLTLQFISTGNNQGSVLFLWWMLYLTVSIYAWALAVVRLPFRFGWMRVPVNIIILCAHLKVVAMIAQQQVQEPVAFLLVLVFIAVAYMAGAWGIGQIRTGETDSKVISLKLPAFLKQRARTFTSAIQAQTWYEWCLHGKSPLIVFLLITFLVIFAGGAMTINKIELSEGMKLFRYLWGICIVTPLFLAIMAGPFWSNFQSNKYEGYDIPACFSALPFSTGDFVWAKYRAVTKSMSMVFILLVIISMLFSIFINIPDLFQELTSSLNSRYGSLETGFLVALLIPVFLIYITANIANIMWLPWALRDYMQFIVAGFVLIMMFGHGLGEYLQEDPGRLDLFFEYLPWILAGLALIKSGGLVYLAREIKTRRLYPSTRILFIGSFWLLYVLILFSLALRYLPEGMVSWYALLAGLVIFTPVLGIMGAPLALHYNRHR